jgi:hypothetical protein
MRRVRKRNILISDEAVEEGASMNDDEEDSSNNSNSELQQQEEELEDEELEEVEEYNKLKNEKNYAVGMGHEIRDVLRSMERYEYDMDYDKYKNKIRKQHDLQRQVKPKKQIITSSISTKPQSKSNADTTTTTTNNRQPRNELSPVIEVLGQRNISRFKQFLQAEIEQNEESESAQPKSPRAPLPNNGIDRIQQASEGEFPQVGDSNTAQKQVLKMLQPKTSCAVCGAKTKKDNLLTLFDISILDDDGDSSILEPILRLCRIDTTFYPNVPQDLIKQYDLYDLGLVKDDKFSGTCLCPGSVVRDFGMGNDNDNGDNGEDPIFTYICICNNCNSHFSKFHVTSIPPTAICNGNFRGILPDYLQNLNEATYACISPQLPFAHLQGFERASVRFPHYTGTNTIIPIDGGINNLLPLDFRRADSQFIVVTINADNKHYPVFTKDGTILLDNVQKLCEFFTKNHAKGDKFTLNEDQTKQVFEGQPSINIIHHLNDKNKKEDDAPHHVGDGFIPLDELFAQYQQQQHQFDRDPDEARFDFLSFYEQMQLDNNTEQQKYDTILLEQHQKESVVVIEYDHPHYITSQPIPEEILNKIMEEKHVDTALFRTGTKRLYINQVDETLAFPDKFAYGVGGINYERQVAISPEKIIKHWFDCGLFNGAIRFMVFCYEFLVSRNTNFRLFAGLRVQNGNDIGSFGNISVDELRKMLSSISNQEADNNDSGVGSKMFKLVAHSTETNPASNNHRRSMNRCLKSLVYHVGQPTLFITISINCKHNANLNMWLQWLKNNQFNPNTPSIQVHIPSEMECLLAATNDPATVADFFLTLHHGFMEHIVGWDMGNGK